MTEAHADDRHLKRKVLWRARMLALQDYAAMILIVGGSSPRRLRFTSS